MNEFNLIIKKKAALIKKSIINTHENGMKKEEVDPREKIILDIL